MSDRTVAIERAIISAVMTFGSDATTWLQVAQVDARDFLDERHEVLWRRLAAWRDREVSAGRDLALDPFVMLEELKREGLDEKAGGAHYIVAELTTVPDDLQATSIGTLARQLVEGAQTRRLMHLLPTLASRLGESTEHAHAEIMGEIRQAVAEATEVSTGDRWEWISKYSKEIWDLVDRPPPSEAASSKVIQIPTGMRSLDHALGGGVSTTDLTCIAARTSVGKSAMSLNIFTSIAQTGRPVGIISLETTAPQLGLRALAGLSRVDVKSLIRRMNDPRHRDNPKSFENEWERLARAAEKLHELPILFVDEGHPTAEEIVSLMHIAHQKHGVRCFVVDYLQKIKPSSHTRNWRHDLQVGHSVSVLKTAAKTLGVWILMVAQLNRGPDQRENKRPTMTDLRGSGRIEEEVDGVWFLFREGYYAEQAASAEQLAAIPEHVRRHAELSFAKGRNDGNVGKVVKFNWFAEFQKFDDPAPEWMEDGMD